MMKLVIGSLVAALAVFAFGAAYWMSPLGSMAFAKNPNDDATQAALAGVLPATGSYVIPQDMESPDQAAWEARHEKGPLAVVHFSAEGMPPMMPGTLLRGFLHSFTVALLLGLLLRLMGASVTTYRGRLLLVALIGLIAAIYGQVGAHVWWLHSTAFTATVAVYDVLAFVIFGAILAAFVKPEQT